MAAKSWINLPQELSCPSLTQSSVSCVPRTQDKAEASSLLPGCFASIFPIVCYSFQRGGPGMALGTQADSGALGSSTLCSTCSPVLTQSPANPCPALGRRASDSCPCVGGLSRRPETQAWPGFFHFSRECAGVMRAQAEGPPKPLCLHCLKYHAFNKGSWRACPCNSAWMSCAGSCSAESPLACWDGLSCREAGHA